MKKICFRAVPALLLLATWASPGNADTSERVEALAEAYSAFEKRDYETAQSAGKLASEDSRLRPWALLIQGLSEERRGKLDDSRRLLAQIPEGSPASLDARVALLRLDLVSNPKDRSLDGEAVSSLQQSLRRNQRKDLLAELAFLRAQLAYETGKFEVASALFLEVRTSVPGKPLAQIARERQWRILERLGKDAPAAMIQEAAQLLKENDPEAAVEKISLAKKMLKNDTAPYFEALALEESAERALGKTESADKLLAEIGAGRNEPTASAAMMKSVKIAWNGDNAQRTLDAIRSFRNRFGASRNADELLYIEARTFDQLGKSDQAGRLYGQLASAGNDASYRLRALRQLAWDDYRKGRYKEASVHFQRGASVAKHELDKAIATVTAQYSVPPSEQDAEKSSKSVRKVREIIDDYLHHRYWFAKSVLGGKLEKAAADSDAVFSELLRIAPHSYYGFLAARASGARREAQKALTERECLLSLPAEKEALFRDLQAVRLFDLAQAEIESFVANAVRGEEPIVELAGAGSLRASLREVRPLLSRAAWSARYGVPKVGVALADSLYKRPAVLDSFTSEALKCEAVLERLAFPAPYSEYFKAAGTEYTVPVALLYAHARTESFFDPLARSTKDARGLLQLLPSTAAREGFPSDQSLFDPKWNVRFGAKHLAGLLKQYDGRYQLAAAAYNAGPGAVAGWTKKADPDDAEVWTELISYPETRDYVKKITLAKLHYERHPDLVSP